VRLQAAVVLNNLAMVFRQKGDLDEAERLLQQALNLRR
jgi:Flp pilus assembly protein TadD